MKAVILGGNSINNRSWAEQVAKHLEATGYSTYVHIYKHWKTGEAFMDVEYELKMLGKSTELSDEYFIVAKSIGSLLALRGMNEKLLRPVSSLFLGFPLAIIEREAIPTYELLKEITGNFKFIQNDDDPLGSFKAVRQHLTNAGISSDSMSSWPGDSHDYLNIEAIVEESTSLLPRANSR